MNQISITVLRKMLKLDRKNWRLYWRERDAGMFNDGNRAGSSWNSKYAGREAFVTPNGRGYLTGSIFGRNYYAHRVIWAMYYGVWPSGCIDHINGNTEDNRIENLREATVGQNNQNSMQKIGVSGVRGVRVKRGKFSAQIKVNGKKLHIGTFETPEAAGEAYAQAARKYHGEFAYIDRGAAE